MIHKPFPHTHGRSPDPCGKCHRHSCTHCGCWWYCKDPSDHGGRSVAGTRPDWSNMKCPACTDLLTTGMCECCETKLFGDQALGYCGDCMAAGIPCRCNKCDPH